MFIYDDPRGYEVWKTKHLAVDLPGEVWKPIPSFPKYAASNLGRIKRIKDGGGSAVVGALMRPSRTDAGYEMILLRKNGKSHGQRVHGLVAETFIGPRPDSMTINHKDGNPSNNRAENLEYMTQRDNIYHAAEILGVGPFVLAPEDATNIRIAYLSYKISLNDIAAYYQTHPSTIRNVLARRTYETVDALPAVEFDGPIGSNHPYAVLDEASVVWCRREYKARRRNLQQLADMFNVNKSNMSRALRGETWKHVAEPTARKRTGHDYND